MTVGTAALGGPAEQPLVRPDAAPPAQPDQPDLPDLPRFVLDLVNQARSRPQGAAVVDRSGVTDFGTLLAESERWMERLGRTPGLQPGHPVALLAERNAATVATLLGCLRGGYPPVILSAALPVETRDTIMADANAAILVEGERITPRRSAGTPLEGTSLILATSGSTGAPKGVRLSGPALDRFVEWARGEFGVGPEHTALSLAPLSFDISLLDVWTTLASGGTVVLPSTVESLRGTTVVDLIRRHGIRMVQAVPLFFAQMAAAPGDCPNVDHVVLTGDATDAPTLESVRRLFPNARVANVYGATETNDTFLHVVTAWDETPLPLGKPLQGVQALVLGEAGLPLSGAGRGELWVHSPFAGSGYTDPQRDVGRWGPDPRSGSGPSTWFRTGDLVDRDQNSVFRLAGRTDRQTKVRGVAVNLDQVESVLASHHEVLEVAASTEVGDEPGQQIVAVLRLGPAQPSLRTLRQHCALHLPAAAVPGRITVVSSPLARTTTGKLDRTLIFDSVD